MPTRHARALRFTLSLLTLPFARLPAWAKPHARPAVDSTLLNLAAARRNRSAAACMPACLHFGSAPRPSASIEQKYTRPARARREVGAHVCVPPARPPARRVNMTRSHPSFVSRHSRYSPVHGDAVPAAEYQTARCMQAGDATRCAYVDTGSAFTDAHGWINGTLRIGCTKCNTWMIA